MLVSEEVIENFLRNQNIVSKLNFEFIQCVKE